MSETVSDPHRLTALELANHHVGEAPNQIVDRAHAYHAFLTTGKSTGKPATAGTTQTAAAACATGRCGNRQTSDRDHDQAGGCDRDPDQAGRREGDPGARHQACDPHEARCRRAEACGYQAGGYSYGSGGWSKSAGRHQRPERQEHV